MQEVKHLELRIPFSALNEADWERFTEAMDSVGSCIETNTKNSLSQRVAWFAADADLEKQRARLTAACLLHGIPAADIQLKLLDTTDWATAWQKNWHAMPIGQKFWVRPSFCEPAPKDRIDIVLDPGMAFGTGQHATTRLCLEVLERWCACGLPNSMLDMGAGSGILAIAAAKLGVGRVLAVDNDPEAVAACEKNAAINGVFIESRLGDVPPTEHFDLVVANILAGPLIEMAPKLSTCVKGHLILSGLLSEQVDAVKAAYERENLKTCRLEVADDWVAIEMHRTG